MTTRPPPKSTTTSMSGPASSPPCSPNARPATPVSASPTRAGSRSLRAPARTGNRLREPQYHADVILCLRNVALREAAAVPYSLVMTPEVRAWLHDLRKRDRASAIQVGQAIGMLLEAGPELGRPLADRVRHSRLSNLKELRPGSAGRSEIRILYIFDPRRKAVLLIAGDKAGKWEAWYRQAIPLAEQRYEDYLKQEDIQ